MLPVGIGLLILPMKIRFFDITSENLAFNVANENLTF